MQCISGGRFCQTDRSVSPILEGASRHYWTYIRCLPPSGESPLSLLAWIQLHTAGWEIFLPLVLALALAGTPLKRSSRAAWLPYFIVAAWSVAMGLVYLASGTDRFWYFARRRWAFMVATILLAGSIPIAAAAGFLLARAPSRWRPRTQALCSALAGIVAIPLTNLASGLIGRLSEAYLPAD